MEPKRNISVGPVVLRRQPPVVGQWCSPPTSKKAHEQQCVYRNAACGEGSKTCDLCFFPFCDEHYRVHSRRFEMPADVWREILSRKKRWLTLVSAKRTRQPKIAPQFPPEDPGDVDCLE
jgi:hypothetical protein